MAALTGPRNTPRLGELLGVVDGLAKANAVIHKGSLVCKDATGYTVPGGVATTLKAQGMADTGSENKVDATGEASGALKFRIECGVFRWNNSSAGDAITIADLYADCYIVDDQTVAKTDGTGTRSVAGKIMAVDSSGVWVKTGPF